MKYHSVAPALSSQVGQTACRQSPPTNLSGGRRAPFVNLSRSSELMVVVVTAVKQPLGPLVATYETEKTIRNPTSFADYWKGTTSPHVTRPPWLVTPTRTQSLFPPVKVRFSGDSHLGTLCPAVIESTAVQSPFGFNLSHLSYSKLFPKKKNEGRSPRYTINIIPCNLPLPPSPPPQGPLPLRVESNLFAGLYISDTRSNPIYFFSSPLVPPP